MKFNVKLSDKLNATQSNITDVQDEQLSIMEDSHTRRSSYHAEVQM